MFKQRSCDEVKAVAIVGQYFAATFLCLSQNSFNFFVDNARSVVGIVTGMHEVFAQENLSLRAPCHRPDSSAHAPFANHLAGKFCRTYKVVVRSSGDDVENEILGHTPAHADDQHVLDVVLSVDVTFLDGQLHRHAEGHSGRNDRYFVQRVGSRKNCSTDGMASLVVSDGFLFLVGKCH